MCQKFNSNKIEFIKTTLHKNYLELQTGNNPGLGQKGEIFKFTYWAACETSSVTILWLLKSRQELWLDWLLALMWPDRTGLKGKQKA